MADIMNDISEQQKDPNIVSQLTKATDLPNFTLQDLVESGVHFGHRASRWNPKMAPYIYGVHNGIHIINLQKTVPLLKRAMQVLHNVALERGRILFVGTKLQASAIITEAAVSCGQYYVNHRWLGGMLTNWSTVSVSIQKLQEYEQMLKNEDDVFTKKEILKLDQKRIKLEKSLGGIREMGGMPNILFVIDTNKEHIAIKEAQKLKIPVVAVLDTNSDPTGISYPIPGNDDAKRSIELYCKLISRAILTGIESDLAKSGVRIDDIKNSEFIEERLKNNSRKEDGRMLQRKYRNKNFVPNNSEKTTQRSNEE